MRDPGIVLVHLIVTLARLVRLGGGVVPYPRAVYNEMYGTQMIDFPR